MPPLSQRREQFSAGGPHFACEHCNVISDKSLSARNYRVTERRLRRIETLSQTRQGEVDFADFLAISQTDSENFVQKRIVSRH